MPDGDEQARDARSRGVLPSVRSRRRTPVTPESSPSTSSTAWFQTTGHLAGLHALEQPVLQDLLRAQLVAPVDERDVRGDVRQVQRFFDRGVAAADDGDVLVAEEEPVAGGAGRDALAAEGLLGRQAEVLGRGAGGDDQRIAGVARRSRRPARTGRCSRSTVWMWSLTISVSKRSAWRRMRP